MYLVYNALISRNFRPSVLFPVKVFFHCFKRCVQRPCCCLLISPFFPSCKTGSKWIWNFFFFFLKGIFQTCKISFYRHIMHISHTGIFRKCKSGHPFSASLFKKQQCRFFLRNKCHIKSPLSLCHSQGIDFSLICLYAILSFHILRLSIPFPLFALSNPAARHCRKEAASQILAYFWLSICSTRSVRYIHLSIFSSSCASFSVFSFISSFRRV